jgi:stringent starvation protein B
MSPTQPLPPKKDVALALLERSSVYVHLDPRQVAVVVPPWFKKQPQLVLQIGLNMHVPIPDLRLDDDGMSCTLSFNRAPFYCVVPWGSVFAIVGDDGRGMVWPEDVPAEVARQVRVVDAGAQKETPKAALVRQGDREPKAEAPKAKRARKQPILAAVADSEKEPVMKAEKAVRVAERRPQSGTPPPPAIGSMAGQPGAKGAAGSAVAQAPAGRAEAAGARRKKRRKELPPYLRVVK